MKVFVTGAGGFLGRAVAVAAADAGHEVVALIRPAAPPHSDIIRSGISLVLGDLRQPCEWRTALAAADAVVHCAAAFGDLAAQLTGTVLATENLLASLPRHLARIVHVSSLSVYDFASPGWRRTLDEHTALEPAPLRRDAYTQTKLIQERLIREYAAGRGTELVIVRPGAIYGPGKDWDWGRALRAGPFDLIFAPLSPLRLIHVTSCAQAIVAALSAPIDTPLTVNLVDPATPSHWRFHALARRAGAPVGIALPVPYIVVRGFGLLARLASKLFFGGRARLPEMLDPPRQQVRWRGLYYPSDRATKTLDWRPSLQLRQAIAAIVHGNLIKAADSVDMGG